MTRRAEFENPTFEEQDLSSRELRQLLDFQREMLESIVEREDYGVMLDEVCLRTEALAPDSLATVMLYRAAADALFMESAPSASEEILQAMNGLRPGEGSCGNVVYHNDAMYVCDTSRDARWNNYLEVAARIGIRSCFAYPIFTGDRQSIGSFAISSPKCREPRGFHQALLNTGASLCGIILRRRADDGMRAELLKEQLRSARLESLGVVAGGIAHDFNNLLTSIVGHLDLAQTTVPEGQVATNLEQALGAAERAQGLTAQLLTVARGESPTRQPSDILAIIRESAEFILHGGNVGVEVINACEEAAPIVNVDTGQISQLVQNLVLNARQAMPDGGIVRITVDIVDSGSHPILESGDYLRMTVSDSGPGVPQSIRDHIFDPYVTAKDQGTGLGLFVCDSIVKAHGGLISVADPAAQTGGSFVVHLPYEAGLSKASPPTATPARPDLGGRALVMDDEAAVREMVCLMLGHLNFDCVETADGEAAASAFERARQQGQPFDVTIVDLTVPGGIGGVETRDLIRAIDPTAKVIVSSGYPLGEDDGGAERFSASLHKPYRIAELRRVLCDVLGQS